MKGKMYWRWGEGLSKLSPGERPKREASEDPDDFKEQEKGKGTETSR